MFPYLLEENVSSLLALKARITKGMAASRERASCFGTALMGTKLLMLSFEKLLFLLEWVLDGCGDR